MGSDKSNKIIENLKKRGKPPETIASKKVFKISRDSNFSYLNLESNPVLRLAMLKALKKDIALFVEKILGATPSDQQKKILDEFNKPGSKISVRSGHGVGKSAMLSWMILHTLYFYSHVRILCTAPSSQQMFDVLWAELKMWRSNIENPWWREQVRVTRGRAEFVLKRNGDGSIDDDNRFATARTARKEEPVALQGIHGQNVVILVDEASGVAKEVFEVGEGAMTTAGSRVVLTGNPTDISPDNYFFKTQTKEKKNWKCFKLSSLDSPFVDKKWIEDVKIRYGEDSNFYRVRVLGEFPEIGEDLLIPIHWVQNSWGREVKTPGADRIGGVDPARYGDDTTAFVVREGGRIVHIEQWAKQDTMYSAARVADKFREMKLDYVAVDVIGLGSGVADRLKQLVGRDKVIEVNVAERPAARERYNRFRDELWFSVREFFQNESAAFDTENISSAMFERLQAELTCVHYKYQGNGKLKVDSKDDMRSANKASPDLADALCLTFVKEVAGEAPKQFQYSGRARPVVGGGGWGSVQG
jgi:hypothetical protein